MIHLPTPKACLRLKQWLVSIQIYSHDISTKQTGSVLVYSVVDRHGAENTGVLYYRLQLYQWAIIQPMYFHKSRGTQYQDFALYTKGQNHSIKKIEEKRPQMVCGDHNRCLEHTKFMWSEAMIPEICQLAWIWSNENTLKTEPPHTRPSNYPADCFKLTA